MEARIWNDSSWIKETNPQEIKEKFSNILSKAGFKVLDFTEHHFKPFGYTALWLLSESHFAVHTFPEFGKSYIEISSCNLEYFQTFLKLTKEYE
jgi:hypothetical protein